MLEIIARGVDRPTDAELAAWKPRTDDERLAMFLACGDRRCLTHPLHPDTMGRIRPKRTGRKTGPAASKAAPKRLKHHD